MDIYMITLLLLLVLMIILLYSSSYKNTKNHNENMTSLSNDAAVSVELAYTGDILMTKKLKITDKFNLLPTCIIVAWSGPSNQIPYGWVLCDGSNNTPDLRARFIVGVGKNPNLEESWSPGGKGGNQKITLNNDTMPRHSHQLWVATGNRADALTGVDGLAKYESSPVYDGRYGYNATTKNGLGESFYILPPFYTVAYIMRKE